MAAIDGIGFGRKASIMNGVARATECLVGAPQWRRAMNEVLATLGASAGVSRVYLFERLTVPGDHMRVSQTFEWVASGVAPQIDHPELRDFDLGLFPRWTKRLRAGEPVFGDVTDFPDEERPLLEEQGIVSILVQPVSIGGTLWGFLGFDACVGPQRWEPVEIDALRIASLVLGSKVEAERRENEARQSHKMEALGRMAGGVAHDFNNILAAILGNVALAREDAAGAAPVLTSLDQINRAALRARHLVQQILAFSRREQHGLAVQPLRPIVEESLGLLRATLPAGVQLDAVLPDALLPVRADATQLQQVLINLCTNAWHALPEQGGRIEVGCERVVLDEALRQRQPELASGAYAHLWVSDNGAGMDAATRERIFDPFFTTKPVGRGTGLGLSVVHGIVRAHEGSIAVDTAPGRGSRFHLYIPSPELDGEGAEARPAQGADVRGSGQRVLYVDDDEVMVVMVERLLVRAGFLVATESDATAAVQRLQADPQAFDAVVTDFNMPGMSGLEVARIVIGLRPALPVVISTGYLSDELRSQALSLGVRGLLKKENTLEELAGLLRDLLAPR